MPSSARIEGRRMKLQTIDFCLGRASNPKHLMRDKLGGVMSFDSVAGAVAHLNDTGQAGSWLVLKRVTDG